MNDRYLIPLTVIELADKELRDTTRIQKLSFIAQEKLNFPAEYVFVPYDYGPFSKDLAEDLQTLRETNLISREFREVEGKQRCFYSLTNEGKFQVVRLQDKYDFSEKEKLHDLVLQWEDENLTKLINYVYSEWPRYATESII